MTVALIPAGGKSTRMGKPKLALPLAGRAVLEHVIAALRQAGVENVLVVISPQVPELVPVASLAGAATLLLAHETADMRSTVEQGLTWMEKTWDCRLEDPWLLVPADHPTLNAEVVRMLVAAYQPGSPHSIIIPTYGGKRGHPCLLAWQHVSAIRALAPGLGINAYLRRHAQETLELPVATGDVLLDLDTPEDYERLMKRLQGKVALEEQD
jgi:molybdenum cofactor cytidylyltransferase